MFLTHTIERGLSVLRQIHIGKSELPKEVGYDDADCMGVVNDQNRDRCVHVVANRLQKSIVPIPQKDLDILNNFAASRAVYRPSQEFWSGNASV